MGEEKPMVIVSDSYKAMSKDLSSSIIYPSIFLSLSNYYSNNEPDKC